MRFKAESAAAKSQRRTPMQRRLWKAAGLVTLAVALIPIPVLAQNQDPVQANRELAAAFESAWNTHDMEGAFRRLLAGDIDWVNVNAGHGKGIEPVVQGHARVHSGKFRESVMTVKNVDVALLSPDVALVHVSWEMRGDKDDDGTPREPREGLFTWVTVREGAAWKIRASHNTNKTPVR
jgi:uncharacterized protein (TIGR02246 family)